MPPLIDNEGVCHSDTINNNYRMSLSGCTVSVAFKKDDSNPGNLEKLFTSLLTSFDYAPKSSFLKIASLS